MSSSCADSEPMLPTRQLEKDKAAAGTRSSLSRSMSGSMSSSSLAALLSCCLLSGLLASAITFLSCTFLSTTGTWGWQPTTVLSPSALNTNITQLLVQSNSFRAGAAPPLGFRNEERAQPGEASGADGGAAEGVHQAAYPRGTPPTCWPAQQKGEWNSSQGGGLRVHGSGCAVCAVGEHCTFTISVSPPAHWKAQLGDSPFQWDLMVNLVGPALVHAYVTLAPTALSRNPTKGDAYSVPRQTFVATYQPWDAGVYRVSLANPCLRLVLPSVSQPPYAGVPHISEIASWLLRVDERSPGKAAEGDGTNSLRTQQKKKLLHPLLHVLVPSAPQYQSSGAPAQKSTSLTGQAGSKDSPKLTTAAEVGEGAEGATPLAGASPDQEPCLNTLGARWLRMGGSESEYRWTPFECAGSSTIEEQFLRLFDSGVREVAFVGDSHLRLVVLHSVFLLTGDTHYNLFKAHYGFDIFVPVRNASAADGAGEAGGPEGIRTQARERIGSSLPAMAASGNTAAAQTGSNTGAPRPNATQTDARLGSNTTSLNLTEVLMNQLSHVPAGIRFRFLWVDGVYQNQEFGCRDRGYFSHRTTSFPGITSMPDIVVLDSGAWSAFKCRQPALAYSAHLNEFVDHVKQQLNHSNSTRTVFFGGVPNPACVSASLAATNSLISFEARLAQALVAHHGVQFFNTWEVVAPHFHTPCIASAPGGRQTYDVHFSCWNWTTTGGTETSPQRKLTMTGVVGEVLARAVFQFLVDMF